MAFAVPYDVYFSTDVILFLDLSLSVESIQKARNCIILSTLKEKLPSDNLQRPLSVGVVVFRWRWCTAY